MHDLIIKAHDNAYFAHNIKIPHPFHVFVPQVYFGNLLQRCAERADDLDLNLMFFIVICGNIFRLREIIYFIFQKNVT